MQAWIQVFWSIPSITSGRKSSLQTRTAQEVKNSWCFSRVTAGARHHKDGTSRRLCDAARVWNRWQCQVQSGGNSRQRGLCKRVRSRIFTRALLSDLVEKLFWGRKYLGARISSTSPWETGQDLLRRASWQANSKLLSCLRCSANG